MDDLNINLKTIKILKVNIAENLCDLKLGKYFLNNTPKTQLIKE